VTRNRLKATSATLAAIACALVVMTCAASVANADPAGDAYKQARASFGAGEYDEALAAADAGLAAAPKHLRLLLLKGQILLEKRDYEGAIAAYEAFLAAGPRGANKRKAQKIVRNLQVVQETFITVEVTNGPASVYIDSESLGEVCVAEPICKKGFVPGTYRVIVKREGFETARESVTLRRGESAGFTGALVEKPSELTVRVSPEDAAIAVDGEPLGAGEARSITPGAHEITATRDGYLAATKPIEARRGEPVAVDLRLDELIPLDVTPEDAALSIDGAEARLEGGELVVPAGTGAFTLRATRAGYRDAEIPVAAAREPGRPIEVTLEKIPEPPPPPPPPPAEWTGTKIALVAGAGAVALVGFGLGTASGISAAGHRDDAEQLCEPADVGLICATEEGFEATEDARDASATANVLFGVGLVGALGAVAALSHNEVAGEGAMSRRRMISIGAAGAVAVTGLAVGAVYGLRARSRWNESQITCDGAACDPEGFVLAAEARGQATVANVGFAVGAAAAGAAAYLWLSRPGPRAAAGDVSVAPAVSQRGAGVSLRSSF
jgi:hypothetical protein